MSKCGLVSTKLLVFLWIFLYEISNNQGTGTEPDQYRDQNKTGLGPIIGTRNDRDQDQSSGPEMTGTGTGTNHQDQKLPGPGLVPVPVPVPVPRRSQHNSKHTPIICKKALY